MEFSIGDIVVMNVRKPKSLFEPRKGTIGNIKGINTTDNTLLVQ